MEMDHGMEAHKDNVPLRTKRMRAFAAAAISAVAAVAVAASLSDAASLPPHGGQRVDMKVLLLANTAADPDATGWADNLRREGTPFARINASDAGTLNDATFASGDHALYQAVIAVGANGTSADGRPDQFTPAEWTALRSFETKFGIRQLNPNAVPGPSLGSAFGTAAGQLDGITGTVTAAGKTQFPNLAGTVPLKDLDPGANETFGSGTSGGCDAATAACLATSYTPLVTATVAGLANSSLMGLAAMKDGREEISYSFSGNENQLHTQILRHALLGWVTGGVYIGRDRSYFAMDIDDVFLPDTKWDPIGNTTPGDGSAVVPNQPAEVGLRMTAADLTTLLAYQTQQNIKFNLLFNGGGVGEFQAANGGVDPLFNAFKANNAKAQFTWINHTFDHPSLGSPNPGPVSQATIESQISQNVAFATGAGANQLGLAAANFDRADLVTGEHSGIGTSKAANSPTGVVPVSPPELGMPAALTNQRITAVGADNSREAGQRQVGSALTLPRYPMNVFYNVGTFHDQLDEYDWLYLAATAGFVDPATGDEGVAGTPSATTPPRGHCTNNATTTCFTTPVTKAQFIDRESTAVVTHMLGNDPRPHYAHQPNIMSDSANANVANRGDGILYQVLTPALAAYRSYFNTPLLQPGMTALAGELRRQSAWASPSSAQVSGYIQDGKVVIDSPAAREVPLTGTTAGDVYGGRRSGWVPVTTGTTTFDLDQARSTVAPKIAGATATGSVLTATPGTFTGTPAPATTSRHWQRRTAASGGTAAGAWADIPGATATTYTVTAADQGRELRYVETAANVLSTWGMGVSAPLPVNVPASPPAGGGSTPASPSPPSTPGAPASPTTPPSGGSSKPTRAPFTCTIKRSKRTSVSCKLRSAAGVTKAKISLFRGRRRVATATGRVRAGKVPTLHLKRTKRRYESRIVITVRKGKSKGTTLTRTLKV
jgi:hypothetical protein